MPTLVLLLGLASLSATVGVPSALVCELVTEVDTTSRLPPEARIAPVEFTKAALLLTTVPTATAPAKVTLPPPLVLASLLVSCFFDSGAEAELPAAALSFEPLVVDLATAVASLSRSAVIEMLLAVIWASPFTEASVLPLITVTPTVAPWPALVPSPMATPIELLLADTETTAPAALMTALPEMRAWVFVVMPTVATAASVVLSVCAPSPVMSATILTVEVASNDRLVAAVTWLEPMMSTSAVEKPRMKASFAAPNTSMLFVVVSMDESALRVIVSAVRLPSTVTVACVASAARL